MTYAVYIAGPTGVVVLQVESDTPPDMGHTADTFVQLGEARIARASVLAVVPADKVKKSITVGVPGK